MEKALIFVLELFGKFSYTAVVAYYKKEEKLCLILSS